MGINFPANPVIGQTYTYGIATWQWDGTASQPGGDGVCVILSF